jgi:hypothetical protein
MRQKAMTDPVDPDHLISGELTEKLTIATVMAISPIDRDRGGTVNGVVTRSSVTRWSMRRPSPA